LAQHLSDCSDSYTLERTSTKFDSSEKWCPICNEVLRQLASPEKVTSLAQSPPFGVCPLENQTLKVASTIPGLVHEMDALRFSRTNPSWPLRPLNKSTSLKLAHKDRVDSKGGMFDFTGWPRRATWETNWGNLVAKRIRDPCSAPVLARARLKPDGLGSNFNNFVNELVVAIYTGKPVALCAPPNVRDVWGLYFQDPGFSRCDKCDFRAGQHWDDAWAVGFSVSRDQDHTQVAEVKRFLYHKMFQLDASMAVAVKKMMHTLGLVDQRFVGVHVRRGDRILNAPPIPIANYAATVMKLCQQVATNNVYVASDDATIVAQLQTALGFSFKVVAQPRLSTEAGYKLRGDASREKVVPAIVEEEEANLLVDIMLLVQADAFAGTASSNIGRFVYFMRDPSKPTVSLDEHGDFLSVPGL